MAPAAPGPPAPSDGDLVAAARDGDMAAFETLYRRHRDWVAELAYRFCGDREEALDVLQEAFAYLVRKLPHLRLRCGFRTFLYPAVKHIALSSRRKTRRMTPVAEVPERESRPEEPDESAGIVRSLPEGQREVVLLRFADGMDLKEIAGALGIPLGTVKSRLHAALATLRARRRREGG